MHTPRAIFIFITNACTIMAYVFGVNSNRNQLNHTKFVQIINEDGILIWVGTFVI